MKNIRLVLLSFAAVVGANAQCASGSLAVIVSKSNATDSLSMPQLRKLIIGDVRIWPDHKKVTVVNRDSGSAVFRCMLSAVIRMSDAEYGKYLLSAEFRGEEPVPVRVADSAVSAVRSVGGNDGGITLVEASLVSQLPANVKVVRINGKAPGEAGYPF